MGVQRHLLKVDHGKDRRSACGINPSQWTRDVRQVTCLACSRTMFMADMEYRQKQVQSKRDRSR